MALNDVIFPPNVQVQDEGITIVDDMTEEFQPSMARGLSQFQVFGGPRIAMTRRMIVRQTDLGQMLAWLHAIRGKGQRFYTSPTYPRRGSIASTELFSNNTFANGTTGWQAQSQTSLSVLDETMIVRRSAIGSTQYLLYPTSNLTVTQYAAYAARAIVKQGSVAPPNGLRWADNLASASFGANMFLGMIYASYVPLSTSVLPGLFDSATSGQIAGDYMTVPWMSFARCGLVDNAPNALLQSDTMDNASWTKTGCTVTGNASAGPDGTTTADMIVETAVTSAHNISQSVTVVSTALEYSASVTCKASTRTWCFVQMAETLGGTTVYAYINLSTGAIGTTSTGANWSNLRVVVVDQGGGFYRISITAKKTNAATTISFNIGAATADNTGSYLGVASTNAILMWHATFAQSSCPCRGTVTLTTAYPNGVAQSGNGLYTKGWPASQSGFLLSGDMIQAGDNLAFITAPAISDAAGLAYLEFGPSIVTSPDDNDAVVVTQPMGKFVQKSDPQITNRFGLYGEISVELEQRY